jgi:antitoxin ParD1/3/4
MNVSLTPELEKFVQKEVGSGMYQTASEVVRAALRRLKQDREPQKPWSPKTLEELEEALAESIASLNRGEGVDGEEAFRRFQKKVKARTRG